MARITKIEDEQKDAMPLRVTRRKAVWKKSPRLRIKCGCCEEAFEIYVDDTPTGDIHEDFLEISGVYGTIDQWRKLFLPLLQIKT